MAKHLSVREELRLMKLQADASVWAKVEIRNNQLMIVCDLTVRGRPQSLEFGVISINIGKKEYSVEEAITLLKRGI